LHGLDAAWLGTYLTTPSSDRNRTEPGTGRIGEGAQVCSPMSWRRSILTRSAVRQGLAQSPDRTDRPCPLLGQVLTGMMADGRHASDRRPLRRAGTLLEAHEDARARLSVERAHTLMRWTRLDERLANASRCALCPAR
jgi:hypothetical protein